MLGSGEGHRPGEIVRVRYGLSFLYVVKRRQAVEIQTPWVSSALTNSSYQANWLNGQAWGLC